MTFELPVREFVSPAVYALRAECPLWTNVPNPDHRHAFWCAGVVDEPVDTEGERPTADPEAAHGPDCEGCAAEADDAARYAATPADETPKEPSE